jgi:hypothetical protein
MCNCAKLFCLDQRRSSKNCYGLTLLRIQGVSFAEELGAKAGSIGELIAVTLATKYGAKSVFKLGAAAVLVSKLWSKKEASALTGRRFSRVLKRLDASSSINERRSRSDFVASLIV